MGRLLAVTATVLVLVTGAVTAPATADGRSPRQGPTDADSLLKDASGNWAAPRCIDDGTSGPRVQPVFVHRSGTPNRYPTFATILQRSMALTTGIVERSSDTTRTVRWVHDASCRPVVWQVGVPQRHTYDLVSLRRYLKRTDPRFRSRDRVYSMWVDSYTSPRWSGLGDTRWSATWSSSFGFVWVDAHELFHALGAVSPRAPHSTGKGHCWDEHDVMCYNDGGPTWQNSTPCPPGDSHYRLDCNKDDYFAVAPRPGSWLARNPKANMANSRFLAVVPPRALPTPAARPVAVVRTATTVQWQQEPAVRYDVGYTTVYGGVRWIAQDLVGGSVSVDPMLADRRIFVRAVNDAGYSPRVSVPAPQADVDDPMPANGALALEG